MYSSQGRCWCRIIGRWLIPADVIRWGRTVGRSFRMDAIRVRPQAVIVTDVFEEGDEEAGAAGEMWLT